MDTRLQGNVEGRLPSLLPGNGHGLHLGVGGAGLPMVPFPDHHSGFHHDGPHQRVGRGQPAGALGQGQCPGDVFLIRAVGAQRVLEIGTLGGYSGVWIARALGPEGRLTTIEADPKHASVARRAFARAGVEHQVELLEGRALDILPTLPPGFDAVFVDADKQPLEQYFRHGMRLLRAGGLLLCDNSFFNGRVTDPSDTQPDIEGVRAFNRLAATDRRLVATIVPVRDGLLVGVKTADG